MVLSSSGQVGVPRVDKRGLTEPQPFQFVSDDRAEARAARLGCCSGAAAAGPSAASAGLRSEQAAGQDTESERGERARRSRKSIMPQVGQSGGFREGRAGPKLVTQQHCM